MDHEIDVDLPFGDVDAPDRVGAHERTRIAFRPDLQSAGAEHRPLRLVDPFRWNENFDVNVERIESGRDPRPARVRRRMPGPRGRTERTVISRKFGGTRMSAPSPLHAISGASSCTNSSNATLAIPGSGRGSPIRELPPPLRGHRPAPSEFRSRTRRRSGRSPRCG